MNVSVCLYYDDERMNAHAKSGPGAHWVDVELGSKGEFTVFVPSRGIAERLAAGINAAWQEPGVPSEDFGDTCACAGCDPPEARRGEVRLGPVGSAEVRKGMARQGSSTGE